MSRSLLLRGIGVTAELIVDDGAFGAEQDALLLDELRHVWARCLVTDGSPETTVHLRLGDGSPSAPDRGTTVVGRDIESLLTSATQSITHALLAQRLGLRLLLHAGCVAHPTSGDALVFAAGGGTGKTTLTIGLSSRYAYVTDETVSIDADGLIEPYPKPLSIVGAGRYHKGERSPDALGLVPLSVQPVLRGLVLLNRVPDAREVTVEELSLLDAVEGIVPQSSSVHLLPDPLQTIAATIDLVDGVQRWTYSEWESLRPLVEERLGVAP